MNILFTISLCILSITTLGKEPGVPKHHFYDNGELHSMITGREARIQHATYFLIAAQTDLSVNTGSSAVINAYRDMRAISTTLPIYFVLNNNGGVPAKDMEWYLQNVYRLSLKTDSNLHIIENKELYGLLHYGGATSKMLYIYNTRLAYKESAKYSFITNATLPLPKFTLSETRTVPLDSDTIRMSYLDYFMPLSENEMLFLTDVQNEIVVFDLHTGKISKKFVKEKSGVDLYCELIAKNNANCDTARRHNSFLEELNRKNYYIFNMSYDNEHIYLSAGIQVMVRLTQTVSFKNDEGGKDYTIDTGRLFGYGYNILAVLDKNLRLQKHYLIDENVLPGEDILLCTECAFQFTDSTTLLSSVSPDKKGDPMMVKLKVENKNVVFSNFLPPVASKLFIKKMDANVFNYIVEFNNNQHFITDIDNGIYDIRYPGPVSTLTGDGTPLIKERIPKYYEESEEYKLNFHPVSMSTDDSLLYIVYKHKDRYLLEIKNKQYETADVINLSHIKGITQIPEVGSGENITLYKNKLFIKYLEGDSYNMTVYDINRLPETQ